VEISATTVAWIGVAGTAVGGLLTGGLSSLTTFLQQRGARQQEEAGWLREHRYELYRQIVKEAHAQRGLLNDFENSFTGPPGMTRTDRPNLKLGDFADVSARAHLVATPAVRDAWQRYVDAMEELSLRFDRWAGRSIVETGDVYRAIENLLAAVSMKP
jgi:hypothetical protein